MADETYFSDVQKLTRGLTELAKNLTETELVLVQKKLTLDLVAGCIKRTPVDEGRARGGWMVGVGDAPPPNSTVTPDKGEPGNPAGPTLSKAMAAVANLKPYSVCYVVNNVPYLIVLDQGLFDPKDPDDSEEGRKKRAASRSKRDRARADRALGNPGATFVKGGYSIQAPLGIVDATIAQLAEVFK